MSEMTFDLGLQTTSSPDPWTESGYSEWKQYARSVRRAWMEMMGLSDEEIEEQCVIEPPTDLDEELTQYNAMFEVQAINKQNW